MLASFLASISAPLIFVSAPDLIVKFPSAFIVEFIISLEVDEVTSTFALPPTPISVFPPHRALYPAVCSNWASKSTFNPDSLLVFLAADTLILFLASRDIFSSDLISTPFRFISPSVAVISIFFPFIDVIFSLVSFFVEFSIERFTDCLEKTPTRSLNRIFVAAPIP